MTQQTTRTESIHDQNDFLTDLQTLRERAERHMERGAVTGGYQAERSTVLRLLNEALATELVCMLRYKRHERMAEGPQAEAVAKEFGEHARQEAEHADRLAERIVQLGGEPDYDPKGLGERAHSEYRVGHDLESMVRENLVAERMAVETYTEMIRFVGDSDPTTRRVLEDILAVEEEHADDMAGFLPAVESPSR